MTAPATSSVSIEAPPASQIRDAGSLPSDFRQAMRRLAATVCVVTARGRDGHLGMTMTSVTSVTMDPPTVLICVNRATRLSGALAVGETFCVNLLRANQEEHANMFGNPAAAAERFAEQSWRCEEELPFFLEDAQANIFCDVESAVTIGTHLVVIGRVRQVRVSGPVAPLLYSDGRYISFEAASVGF